MVVITVRKQADFVANSQFQFLTLDPRRVGYQIVLANTDSATHNATFGTKAELEASQGAFYAVGAGQSVVIPRNFLFDLDGPVEEVWGVIDSINMGVSTVEVILTPLPVDETPR